MAGSTSGISPSFLGLSRSSGQVTHVLLTRSRLCPRPKPGSSLHLHVLSTPPAFVLSQDQTLREKPAWFQSHRRRGGGGFHYLTKELSSPYCMAGLQYTVADPGHDGILLQTVASPKRSDGSNLDAIARTRGPVDRTLLSFQRPWRSRGGDSARDRSLRGHRKGLSGRGPGILATPASATRSCAAPDRSCQRPSKGRGV